MPVTGAVRLHRDIDNHGLFAGRLDRHSPIQQLFEDEQLARSFLEPPQVERAGAEHDRVRIDRGDAADGQENAASHRHLRDQPNHLGRDRRIEDLQPRSFGKCGGRRIGRRHGSGHRVPDPPDLVAVGVEDGEAGESGDIHPGRRSHPTSLVAPVGCNLMKTLPYEVVDVFTDRPFTGNPLAVVFDADGLAGDQMQAIAREFHLSETAFVLPATSGRATYRLRIFTPEEELPFAGHPSVGAAVTASRRGFFAAGPVVQECGAGLLPVAVHEDGRATLTGAAPTVGPELAPEPYLEMVGLTAADYVGPAPRLAGCGLTFPYLSVTPEAVRMAVCDVAAARRLDISLLSLFSWDPGKRTSFTRVFCPGVGVLEDPATGSAALGFGVWLASSGLVSGEGITDYVVRQGFELSRPSTLECAVTARNGVAVGATVTGRVVPVARGDIAVPPFVG